MRCRFTATKENIQKLWNIGVYLGYSLKSALDRFADKEYFFNDSNTLEVGGGTLPSEACAACSGVGFWGVVNICSMGAFSYTFSSFPLDTMIGSYCSLAAGTVMRGINHPYERFTTCPIVYDPWSPLYPKDGFVRLPTVNHPYKAPIIGSDVWIGGQCMLSPNISLGTGCVVAARSNVTKSVPPYAIVGGNPARVIKYRFNDRIIERILASRWWEYDISHLPIKGDAGPEEFLEAFYEHRDKCAPFAPRFLTDILEENDIKWEKA